MTEERSIGFSASVDGCWRQQRAAVRHSRGLKPPSRAARLGAACEGLSQGGLELGEVESQPHAEPLLRSSHVEPLAPRQGADDVEHLEFISIRHDRQRGNTGAHHILDGNPTTATILLAGERRSLIECHAAPAVDHVTKADGEASQPMGVEVPGGNLLQGFGKIVGVVSVIAGAQQEVPVGCGSLQVDRRRARDDRAGKARRSRGMHEADRAYHVHGKDVGGRVLAS